MVAEDRAPEPQDARFRNFGNTGVPTRPNAQESQTQSRQGNRRRPVFDNPKKPCADVLSTPNQGASGSTYTLHDYMGTWTF